MSSESSDKNALPSLLEKCQQLCAKASAITAGSGGKRESFLMLSLEDALSQVELILRVLDEDAQDSRERRGFLKRLKRGLTRKEPSPEQVKDGALPNLNTSQHGLQGNTWTISIPELLNFLAQGRKTGVLWVDSTEENFLLGLVDGNLMHAAGSKTPEGLRLGEILVGLGYLTRRQLERFLSQQGDDSPLSGEALLHSGMINDEELRSALMVQIQHLFRRLIETKNAIFRFRESVQVTLAYPVSLNVNQLLLESARMQDEGTSGELKAKYTLEAWNAWQHDLATSLEKTGKEDSAAARSKKDAPAKTSGEPKESKKAAPPAPLPSESAKTEGTPESSGRKAEGQKAETEAKEQEARQSEGKR